jgi:hypothetical protein
MNIIIDSEGLKTVCFTSSSNIDAETNHVHVTDKTSPNIFCLRLSDLTFVCTGLFVYTCLKGEMPHYLNYLFCCCAWWLFHQILILVAICVLCHVSIK